MNRSLKTIAAGHVHIAQHIRAYYSRVFRGFSAPSPRLPIHQGKDLGAALLYPMHDLEELPEHLWEHFLPCGNPLQHVHPKLGDTILNLGSGVGIDSMALIRLCRFPIHVVNLDVVSPALVESMSVTTDLDFMRFNRSQSSISFVCGEGEYLPFRTESFDWIVMNGVLNLFPDKCRVLREIGQALREKGRLVVMDLCASTDLPDYFEEELDGWAWCMSGACTKTRLLDMLQASGLNLQSFCGTEDTELLYRMGFVAQKAP